MLGQVILGKYKISRQLDEGGMSKIYLARQVDGARDVVVKVLKEPLRAQTKTVEHFRREIYIMSRFQHPYSVTVFDSAPNGPHGPMLVMEYLRGLDLNLILQREGRFTPERTGRLLVQLCDVLQVAHEQGIVHRDLKPGNLMVLHNGTPQETLKVMDYGLAKMSSMLYISPDELVDFSLPPASGTPEYISPEMVRGTELDGRGDLYSVGVVLYEMLTGRRPFLHKTVEGLMVAHAEQRPPTFKEIGMGEQISPALEAVVMSCLAKFPDQRPKDAQELAQAYERALGRRLVVGRIGSSQPGSGVRPALGSGVRPAVTESGVRSAVKGAAPPASRGPMASAPPAVDRNAFRHSVEASMPEAMAMIKLKGFVYDLGGEVVESVPGMIKVRLAEKQPEKKPAGMFGWMSGSGSSGSRQVGLTQAALGTDLELHMERRDLTQTNKLTITLVMRPAGGLATTEWRNRCNQISRDLQAYLMGR